MNESKKLIRNKGKKSNISTNNKNITLKLKIEKKFLRQSYLSIKYIIALIVTVILVIILICLLIIKTKITKQPFIPNNDIQKKEFKNLLNDSFDNNKLKNELNNSFHDEVLNISIHDTLTNSLKTEEKRNNSIIFDIKEYKKNNIDEKSKENDDECNNYDPIELFSGTVNKEPITICENGKSKHICHKNNNNLFVASNGVICKMENIILDPSKWRDNGYIYKGPVDAQTRGCPLLEEGFFNMKCNFNNLSEIGEYNEIYNNYFQGWNYGYNDTEKEEELAPGKIIFFISRNQDSPNLYHGGSEFVNTLSMIYLLNINPEDIQVIFLESIELNDDPFYDLYKNLVSRGGEPIYIKNLKKKYHISSAIHVPINWDSPCFIYSGVPRCKYPTKTYQFYNYLIDKYMNIPDYKDSFESDNEVFYYPKSIVENHKLNTTFTKVVTFQWRRVWPKGRKKQQRILGNGPELAEKLASLLPKNILLRLIDTASLPIGEQIAIARQSDYFVGVHGGGLCLSIYAPNHCILHEILPRHNMNGLLLMASLSGHKTYSDIISSETKEIDENEYFFFDVNQFANCVIQKMKDNNLF